MKLGVVISRAAHQVAAAEALVAGLAAAGDVAQIFTSDAELMARTGFDALAVWGWRRGSALHDLGYDVLVMERAYVGDRFRWTSFGWNGLNGRALWPDVKDSSRWQTNFANLLAPWRPPVGRGYALLLGQVPTDTACRGVDLEPWLQTVADRMRAQGRQVVFRPHPKAPGVKVRGVTTTSWTDLSEDLAGAEFAVSFNSNSGVDAVLAGVPTIAYDEGSMAWSVTSHSVDEPLCIPDRTEWTNRLAWRQWLPAEIAAGAAWPHIKAALHG